ncbi:MAG: hypothetical protein ACD_28C00067G0001 [uncultured bacterium]|nr:MAG: hypothetical protein ACD_28C00067G0001 [uncultured bacterium]
MKDLISKSLEILGKNEFKIVVPNNGQKAHEANYLKLYCTKTMDKLRWEPLYSVHRAIEKTVTWYWDFANNSAFDAESTCLEQVKSYQRFAVKRKIPWSGEPEKKS